MCRCGCAGANMPPIAPTAPNVGLSFVPAIQTPTMQTGLAVTATTRQRDWLDYALLFLVFLGLVNANRN